MDLRVLDLDGSLQAQPEFLQQFRPALHDFRWWGPRLRLGCGFDGFRRFEDALQRSLGTAMDAAPALTLLGSGDFHHVTLALLRRLERPFNLLVLDNHPDWMRGVPLLHCGSWLRHAATLPLVRTIFHVGGDVDFDNGFRWLAPWRELRSGKIRVISGARRFEKGAWEALECPSLRHQPMKTANRRRVEQLLEPHLDDLGRHPLYITLDKDVMTARDAIVNWDSGHLTLDEVTNVIGAFVEAAHFDLAGMDVLGDWSPVRVRGLYRRVLHWMEHPRLSVTPEWAARCNQRTNLALLERLQSQLHLETACVESEILAA